jgi:uncharacterized protein YcnI
MRMIQRAAAVTGLTTLALTAAATAASAHVTVDPDTAAPGSYTKVSFRVPNEEPSADTTKLEVDLPTDHPIASVSVRAVPGWTIKVATTKLATPIKSDDAETTKAVSRITWSGGKIAPGRFEEFDVSLGPLPTGTDRLLFKAAQTYSDGTVVHWDQDPGNGGQEPEHPAPELHLTALPTSAAPVARKAAATNDGTARLLGGLGLAAGLLGALTAAAALIRTRSRS